VPTEFELIDDIRRTLGGNRQGPHGIGHDGVLLMPDDGTCVVLDSMVEHIHFERHFSSWQDVGYKLVARNVSDIHAMGATPTAFLLALVLPEHALGAPLVAGIRQAVAALCPDAACIGGDTTRSPGPAMLSMTMFGRLAGTPWSRASASPGDGVYLQAPTGWAAAGLALLQHQVGTHALPNPLPNPVPDPSRSTTGSHLPDSLADAATRAIAHHRRPPIRPVQFSGGAPDRVACIDVSDGLAADLLHICRASGVTIDIEHLPADPSLDALARAVGASADPWRWSGGDDYAKVVCAPCAPIDADGRPWPQIGRVFAGPARLTGAVPADSEGFRHF
jgi:thiamine-monophosphate kinase